MSRREADHVAADLRNDGVEVRVVPKGNRFSVVFMDTNRTCSRLRAAVAGQPEQAHQ